MPKLKDSNMPTLFEKISNYCNNPTNTLKLTGVEIYSIKQLIDGNENFEFLNLFFSQFIINKNDKLVVDIFKIFKQEQEQEHENIKLEICNLLPLLQGLEKVNSKYKNNTKTNKIVQTQSNVPTTVVPTTVDTNVPTTVDTDDVQKTITGGKKQKQKKRTNKKQKKRTKKTKRRY